MDEHGYRELLRARRRELEAELGATEAELAQVRAARAESADDEHDPEGSTLSSDWSRIEGLRASSAPRLAAIDSALARLDDATYGLCLRCGRPIGDARLEARPATAHCIDCARTLGL